MPGERLKNLKGQLFSQGGAFKESYGSVWGLSVTGEKSSGEEVFPRDVVHSNWVRYLHTPDIWEEDTQHWTGAKAQWSEGGKLAHIQQIVGKRNAFGRLLKEWCGIIEEAQWLIDITSLEVPAPGSLVATEIIKAITNKVTKWQPTETKDLVIRMLFGGTPQSKTKEFRNKLAEALGKNVAKKGGRIIILFASDYRGVAFREWKYAGESKTWNHSKIVASDGWRAITGGHNMNAEGSYTKAPVIHDLSVEVLGHGAQLAHDFASSLWEKASSTEFLDGYYYDPEQCSFIAVPKMYLTLATDHAEAVRTLNESPGKKRAPPDSSYVAADAVMGLGRWGDVRVKGVPGKGIVARDEILETQGFQYCSDRAKRFLIEGARKSICVSQQDLVSKAWKGLLGYTDTYHDACYALAQRLTQLPRIEINVVVSARYAQDSGGAPYSYGNSPRLARDLISEFAHSKIAEGNVCTVAPLVFCEATGADRNKYVWPDAWRGWTGFYQGHVMQSYGDLVTNGFGPGNHAKALMIDDEVVLIGSDNMYPSPLAEFSFVIEGADAVGKYREVYWSKMWMYSRRMGLKLDHTSKTDDISPEDDFKDLQRSAAMDKKAIELALTSRDKKDKNKKEKPDTEVFKLVRALSLIEQITTANDLEACYRALHFLPPETDLSLSLEEMRTLIYKEYLSVSAVSVKRTVVKSQASTTVKSWKTVEGVNLSTSHQEMLDSEEEWLDDRVMDAYVASRIKNSHVFSRYDVPVGRFVGTGGLVPDELKPVRGGGNADCEVQVINVGNAHWILAMRFPKENPNAAFVYDSLNNQPTSDVQTQVRRCFDMQTGVGTVKLLTGPRQVDGHACGPFVCAAVKLLVKRQLKTSATTRLALSTASFTNKAVREDIQHRLTR